METPAYKDPLSYAVIGCAMKVHQKMGPGFQEIIYQRCLSIELIRASIPHVREQNCKVFYDDYEVGERRADFIVDDKLVIEIKALVKLEDLHIAQAKNYAVVYDYPKSLLLNFGGISLEYKLMFNPKYHPKPV